ncbi:MAG: hypothetical protein COA43_08580 [Robiginitomaculum sp.]|nr:MAG: hypothetical protein COA43_08580 [Robiginitomaculum sp.]
MNHDTYQNLVNTYGVHPSRWPEAMRADALVFAKLQPEQAKSINAHAASLDKVLDACILPQTSNDLLMTRILHTAQNTPQDMLQTIKTPANDHPTQFLADDVVNSPLAKWKLIAATLLITIGLGFTIGQSVAEHSDYWNAESLYAFNLDNDYTGSEWASTFTSQTQTSDTDPLQDNNYEH